MKSGSIIVNLSRAMWVQFIAEHDDNQSVIFDGKTNYIIENENIAQLALPTGLAALGFTEITPLHQWPKEYQNSKGLSVIEKSPTDFYVNDRSIKYTKDVQEEFDIYELLPISDEANRYL